MPKKYPRNQKREAFWRKALRRRERSGLTITAFCKKEQLKETAYYYWRRKIARRDAERTAITERTPAVTASKFLPVQVIDDQRIASVEVVAPNGLIVHIAEQADTEHVRRILQLVCEIP